VYPVGGGLYVPLNPSAMKASNQTEWSFPAGVVRTPEPVAPNLKSRSNIVTVDATFGSAPGGVLYALGECLGVSLRMLYLVRDLTKSTTLSSYGGPRSKPTERYLPVATRSKSRP
jgi:hypothetical protein